MIVKRIYLWIYSGSFHRLKNESKWRLLVSGVVKLLTVGGLLGSSLATVLALYISHFNYSGGVALQKLHTLLENYPGIVKVILNIQPRESYE